MTQKVTIKVKGMHCVGCERVIKEAIERVKGVREAKVSWVTEKASIEFDPRETSIEAIMKAIKDSGYKPNKMDQREKPKGFFRRLFG
jgi:Cu+-exporting ATPase